MQYIHVTDELRIRFPNRSSDFDVGVEVGVLAALMTLPLPHFTRRISADAAVQAGPLAEKLGYALSSEADGVSAEGIPMCSASFRFGAAPAKPKPRFAVVAGLDLAQARA